MRKPRNSGKTWTSTDIMQLELYANMGMSTEEIAKNLGRTEKAIYNEASKNDISLKPKDKS